MKNGIHSQQQQTDKSTIFSATMAFISARLKIDNNMLTILFLSSNDLQLKLINCL